MKNKKILKKIISIMSSLLAFSLFTCSNLQFNQFSFISTAEESTIIGDANLDNKLNIRDAAFIAQKAVKGRINELPENADHNLDESINIRDAASIARFIAERYIQKVQINFRFASRAEGIELKLANEDYFNNLTQQDLNYRMQKTDATLEEYKEFSQNQILDFTTAQKRLISEAVMKVQKKINESGYNIPFNDEIIFINTTADDECGASGYTQKNQIYLKNLVRTEYYSGLESLIAHEIFHCITRSNPQFRKEMYKIIGFSISEEEPEFPENIKEILISNPDVEKNDSYATFIINGEKRECYMVWYLKKDFEKKGDDIFFSGSTGLIPKDDLSTIYDIAYVPDFWKVLGNNTDYVIAAEECLADNFKYVIINGTERKYQSPEIIKSMDTYMKSL